MHVYIDEEVAYRMSAEFGQYPFYRLSYSVTAENNESYYGVKAKNHISLYVMSVIQEKNHKKKELFVSCFLCGHNSSDFNFDTSFDI